MADDLSAFFAKKKTKAAKKKAIRVEEVGQQLELNLRIERAFHDITEDENLVKKSTDSFVANRVISDEDSEWIQFDSKPQLNFTGEVGTFNYNDHVDEDIVQDTEREQHSQERAKTWNIVPKKEAEERETVVAAVTTTQKFQPYRPPARQESGHGAIRKNKHVDIKSEEMFPSIEAADKIEKQQSEDIRRQRTDEIKRAPSPPPPPQEKRYVPGQFRESREQRERERENNPPPTAQPPPPRANVPPPPPIGAEAYQNAKGEWVKLQPKKEPVPAQLPASDGATSEKPVKEYESWRKPDPEPQEQQQQPQQRPPPRDYPPREGRDYPPREQRDYPPREGRDYPPREGRDYPPREQRDYSSRDNYPSRGDRDNRDGRDNRDSRDNRGPPSDRAEEPTDWRAQMRPTQPPPPTRPQEQRDRFDPRQDRDQAPQRTQFQQQQPPQQQSSESGGAPAEDDGMGGDWRVAGRRERHQPPPQQQRSGGRGFDRERGTRDEGGNQSSSWRRDAPPPAREAAPATTQPTTGKTSGKYVPPNMRRGN